MIDFLWNKRGSLAWFLVVLLLVVGGLAGVTRAALRVEQDQQTQQVQSEHADKVQLALWRLDSRIRTIVAREDSRPFNHFSAVFAPPTAFDAAGYSCPSGSVLEPSPLLAADLPSWMLLHFQLDSRGWESPQVLSPALQRFLAGPTGRPLPVNATPARARLLAELSNDLAAETILSHARRHPGSAVVLDRVLLAQQGNDLANGFGINAQATQEFAYRAGNQSKLAAPYNMANYQQIAKDLAEFNSCHNGEEWLQQSARELPSSPTYGPQTGAKSLPAATPQGPINAPLQLPRRGRVRSTAEVRVTMSPMVSVWLSTRAKRQRLVLVRMVHVEKKEVCQGIVLDAAPLRQLLAEEVQDLFPGATVEPAEEGADDELALTMAALPLRLNPGRVPVAKDPGWTTLRIGLCLAWSAALMALLAVAVGGLSLLNLSERRIRFVSAVTHELRTPLTTLRLYLDLLLGGLVRAEPQRVEYLQTMDAETDRLTRLVNNVLDFSRLERHNPRLTLTAQPLDAILAPVVSAWEPCCHRAGKRLEVENQLAPDALVRTDSALLGQVLGNLLDNACKYSRGAQDPLLRLRVYQEGRQIVFEVEDRGPGVPTSERRTIFRAFHRGRAADATTGGVGLGLALACRWAHLLGGKLSLDSPAAGGACFRVELPADQTSMIV